MTTSLYKHQKDFLELNPDKAFIVWEGGTGKTIGACCWLAKGRDQDALVICNKRIIQKWKNELEKWETKATVISKEQFKKNPVYKWSAIVVDEADEFASPLFTKARSKLAEHLYQMVKSFPQMPVMLATATPVRSNPYNLHTLLCYLGIYYDWKDWRSEFFSLEYRPYLPRPAWLPKSDWRQKIREVLEKHADIVLLKDCVKDLPPVYEEIIETKGVSVGETFVDKHRSEQLGKEKNIIEIAKDFRKVLVVAHYVEQVESLYKSLSKDRQTFMVHGGVKDQEKILKEANESDECFLIVQASLGVGFDADSFSCVIFASMSYKVRDYVQMKYRVRRIHNLHPASYYYLVGGKCDKTVYETIQLGRDFVPSEWNVA